MEALILVKGDVLKLHLSKTHERNANRKPGKKDLAMQLM